MTQAKYFQKLKCPCKTNEWAEHKINDKDCSGIIAGADITSTIKPIYDWVIKGIEFCKIEDLEQVKRIIEKNVIKVE